VMYQLEVMFLMWCFRPSVAQTNCTVVLKATRVMLRLAFATQTHILCHGVLLISCLQMMCSAPVANRRARIAPLVV